MELKRVVVTGLGAITPLGSSVQEYWENLIAGKSGAGPITRFDATNFKTKFACEVKDYNPENYFDKKEARKLDYYAQFALIAADQAMLDSGIDVSALDLDKAGVIWGSGIGGISTMQEEQGNFIESGRIPKFSPFFIPKMISDIAAGHLSMKFGFRGPNFTTVSACASSTNALIDALTYIRLGKAKVMISGGSEASVFESGVGGFNAMRALSTRNEEPEKASRPFDKDRDGFVIAEGGVAIILEEYEHAKARGARIYCEVAGGGMSADAYHLTAPHPDGLGATKVMLNALEDAGMKPEEVDYINVHGTSTPLGDVAEVKAILKVFGEHAYNLSISSTKSMTGHLLGAAGAIESLACIKALQNGIIPPTINLENLDPDIDPRLDLTPNVKKERAIKVAINNTFGFGGHNASVVFKKLD